MYKALMRTLDKKFKPALKKGVQCSNGVYRFFDSGIPLIHMDKIPIAMKSTNFYTRGWYWNPIGLSEWWARYEEVPQERILRVPVEGSFKKTFQEELALLAPEETVASPRIIAMLVVINAVLTEEYLLRDYYVRSSAKHEDGNRIVIGYGFDIILCGDEGHPGCPSESDGMPVRSAIAPWDGRRPDIGLAAVLKN